METKAPLQSWLKATILTMVMLLLLLLQGQASYSSPFSQEGTIYEQEQEQPSELTQALSPAKAPLLVQDSHVYIALATAAALLLFLFPLSNLVKVTHITPTRISRNACCIVAKGP